MIIWDYCRITESSSNGDCYCVRYDEKVEW